MLILGRWVDSGVLQRLDSQPLGRVRRTAMDHLAPDGRSSDWRGTRSLFFRWISSDPGSSGDPLRPRRAPGAMASLPASLYITPWRGGGRRQCACERVWPVATAQSAKQPASALV
jgi:hypothetical protein